MKLEITHNPDDDMLYQDEEENDRIYKYEKLSDIVLEEYTADNEKGE